MSCLNCNYFQGSQLQFGMNDTADTVSQLRRTANVVIEDFVASNGVIQIVDKVMLAPYRSSRPGSFGTLFSGTQQVL